MDSPKLRRGAASQRSVEAAPLRERLAASGRQRFVGRDAEITLFRAALRAAESPFVVLHVHGPGGVGKTTLLRELAREATHCGRCVIRLDGRDLHGSPAGFRRALSDALHDGTTDVAGAARDVPAGAVLLIDTFEKIEPIGTWLREQFLPQLPSRCLVVIAGRNQPAAEWRTDIEWAALTQAVALRNFDAHEADAYLAARGIAAERFGDARAFTHGHPLALSLVADALNQGAAAFGDRHAADVIAVLIDCFLRDVPSHRHREAIEVCAQARNTTEALLAAALQGDDAHALFEWLRHLSFVEEGPHGIFPHDLAREAFIADMQWRAPPGGQLRFARMYVDLVERVRRAAGREKQRLTMEYLFLIRTRPGYRTYYDWNALDSSYAEPASAHEAEAIAAMVGRHEGAQSEAIVRHWLRRQPQAFQIFRDIDGARLGFMALLDISRTTDEDRAVDPALPPALALIERHEPLRSGDVVLYSRFWMHAQRYQDSGTAATNLATMNVFVDALTQPGVAWNFAAQADPELYEPLITGINWPRAPQADFTVGDRRYGVFAHDWRIEPPAQWIAARVGLQPFRPMPFAAPSAPSAAVAPGLARGDFDHALHDALRDFTRGDRLAGNALLQAGASSASTAAELQSLLRDAMHALKANPRDDKLHRVLWLTYIEPLASQEKVAERLGLPFSTYRYRLGKGIERVAEMLWQRRS
jgi:AAA ATPase domain